MRAHVLLLMLAAAGFATPSLETIMDAVGTWAARFDRAAGWAAQEDMSLRGMQAPKRRGSRFGAMAKAEEPQMVSRELVNLYGLTSDPGIHEVRAVTAVDGQPQKFRKDLFEASVARGDREARRKLSDEFNREALDVTASDFGPLVLLFTKGQQSNYEFTLAGKALIGAEQVTVIRYRQNTGSAALHVRDGSHETQAVLTGQIEVRDSDFAPLRITLNSARKGVRDEAEVDYIPRSDGLLLPASVVYRRYVGPNLIAEERSRFRDWRRAADR